MAKFFSVGSFWLNLDQIVGFEFCSHKPGQVNEVKVHTSSGRIHIFYKQEEIQAVTAFLEQHNIGPR